MGESWAKTHGVPLELYPADWRRFGWSAGPLRNRVMAENAQALIALWDGHSRGTENMIMLARYKGLKIHIHRTDQTQADPLYGLGSDGECPVESLTETPSAGSRVP